MNWLEKYFARKEAMMKPAVKVKVDKDNTHIPTWRYRGNPDIKEVHLPDNILYIGKAAFRNCTSLEKINLPPKVNYLHEETFKGCVSLREIIVQNPEPPLCVVSYRNVSLLDDFCSVYMPERPFFFGKKKGQFFERVDKKRCVIRVPRGSVALFRKASEWKEFEIIVEI